jgi:hypothetical protein
LCLPTHLFESPLCAVSDPAGRIVAKTPPSGKITVRAKQCTIKQRQLIPGA